MPRLPRTRLPRIHAEIMITGRSPEFGQSLSLGVHDLTKTIVFAITGNPDWQKPRQLLPLPRAISLYDLSRSLDTTTIDTIEALRQTSGTINIPGLREQTNDFINRCGGPNGIIAYRRRLDETEQLEWRIRSASKELKALRNATFKPDIHAVDYVCMNEAFMATDDTLFDEWGYDEYRKNHPPPRLGAPKKLYERWERRYVRWIEKNAPPWVWSTTKTVWDGLSASEIREQAANGSCNHEFDLDAMMEHEFTEFHDEALDQVNDLHEAATVIDEWLPHAGSGNEIDIALETKIAAWNAKQDIVTWFENKNIIHPAFRGKTQKDAVIWAGKRLKTLKRAQRNKQTRPLRHKPG